jgi:hypothetical protein
MGWGFVVLIGVVSFTLGFMLHAMLQAASDSDDFTYGDDQYNE